MSDTVIKVENLSKKYILSHQSQEKYTTLRDVMANGAKNLGKKLLSPFTFHRSQSPDSPFTFHNSPLTASQEDFYALRDISFEIKRGDRVGIIGRNGAGKSTLLKILSRITEPTSGRIEITGRVASLLEVGTGFHPELTGRENIYLNGAILGMSKADIKRKFDEIVAFSEVERFLDTPVKRYSSGMYVRLAFAVAAHMEPEILIVDEVLAVGDAQFQKKCLGKMEDVGKEGRTVLFVSHNMGAILHLCEKALLLESGSIKYSGDVGVAIDRYHSNVKEVSFIDLDSFSGNRRGIQEFAKIKNISICDSSGQPQTVFGMGETIDVRMTIEFKKAMNGALFGVMLRNSAGVLIHDFRSAFDGFFPEFKPGLTYLQVTIPEIKVYPGFYTIGAWIQQQVGVASDDYVNEALKINITDKKMIGDPRSNFEFISKEGSEVYHQCLWHVTKDAADRAL